MVTASLLACVLLELLNVGRMCDGVHCQVYDKGTESETESGEDVACKEAVRENGVLAPCLALGPGVTVKLCHRVRGCICGAERRSLVSFEHGRDSGETCEYRRSN